MDFSPGRLHVHDHTYHALVFFFQAWCEEYHNTRGRRIRILLRFGELARDVLHKERQCRFLSCLTVDESFNKMKCAAGAAGWILEMIAFRNVLSQYAFTGNISDREM
jgi:hypothetical protein